MRVTSHCRRRRAAPSIQTPPRPDGSEIRLLADARHAATKSSMVEVTLPAGQVSRPVYHRTVEEIWYILEGEGQVWRCPPDAASVGPEPVEGPPPQTRLPRRRAGHPHRLAFPVRRISRNGPLRFLCHTTPPWPGENEAVPAERGGLGRGDGVVSLKM